MRSKILLLSLVAIIFLGGCNLFQKNKENLPATDPNKATDTRTENPTLAVDDLCLTFLASSNDLSPVTNKFCTKNGEIVFDQDLGAGTELLYYCLNNEGYICNSGTSSYCSKEEGEGLCGYGPSIVSPAYSDLWQNKPASILKKMPNRKIAGVDTDCYQLDPAQIPADDVAGITSYELCTYPGTTLLFYSKYNSISGISTYEAKEFVTPAPSEIFTLPAEVK